MHLRNFFGASFSVSLLGLSKVDSCAALSVPNADIVQSSKELLDTLNQAELEKQQSSILQEALEEDEENEDSVLLAIRRPLMEPNYLEHLTHSDLTA